MIDAIAPGALAQLPEKFFDTLNEAWDAFTSVLSTAIFAAWLMGCDQVQENRVEFAEPGEKKKRKRSKTPGPEKPETTETKPVDIRFDVSPKEAVDFFRRKEVVTGKKFYQLEREAQAGAFTVSGVYKKQILQAFKEEIAKALEDGTPGKVVVKKLKDILEGAGHRELGDFHLETVVRTNMQVAYGVGRRAEMERVTDILPYWQYNAVMDDRVRPTHAALNGIILPANHAFWDTYYPPWAFNCRCSATAQGSVAAGYDHNNPSGDATLAYNEDGIPVKAEYGASVYDLSVGDFRGIPRQAGLQKTIQAGANRASK